MTLGEMIARAEARFIEAQLEFGQGTLNAWDEARWLALAALDLPLDSDDAIESLTLTPEQTHEIQSVIDRRVQTREPAAYITGIAWLKGYPFRVDPRVLIPRSFIAELILTHFTPWCREPSSISRALDLCTGSGCLAIMLADQFPQATIVATDLSKDALEVAQLNCEDYEVTDQVTLIQSDLFSDIPKDLGPFDLIISNPPYVPEAKSVAMPREFQHEPDLALYAKDDGMALVRRILHAASGFLSPDGLLVVEVGHEKDACEALCMREFSGLPVTWIETHEQSDNVFCVTKDLLDQHPWRPAQ
ncbi:MAG: adenine-specific methylase/methyltransferase protein [Pseudomonadota bacterium]